MPNDGVLPDNMRPRMYRFALYPNAAEFRRLLRDGAQMALDKVGEEQFIRPEEVVDPNARVVKLEDFFGAPFPVGPRPPAPAPVMAPPGGAPPARHPDRVWLLAEPIGGHSIGSEVPVEAPDAVVSPDGLGALIRVDGAWARAEAVELADAPAYAARRKRELGMGRA
eukprot:12537448-Alexandrium_andersonii.AAC.1